MSDQIRENLTQHRNVSMSGVLLAADNLSVAFRTLIALKAQHTIHLQQISYMPTTAAAQTVTFQDDAGTPILAARVPASQTLPVIFDFGPDGFALTAERALQLANSAAGPAGSYTVTAYQKKTSPTAP